MLNETVKPISKRTLYGQLYDILVQDIKSGKLPEGSYLPNEFLLSTQFSVSIGTVRKAVEQLVHDRLVLRQQGKGTVIADRRWLAVREKVNRIRFGPDADIGGWIFNELDYKIRTADAETAAALQIETGAQVHYIRRLLLNAPSSRIYDESYTPVDLYPDFTSDDAGRRDAVGLAGKNGISFGPMQTRISAVAASQPLARILKVPVATPLLKTIRKLFSSDKIPIEYRTAYCYTETGYFLADSG